MKDVYKYHLPIKFLLHLASCEFYIIVNHDNIEFLVRGTGDALGLSLFGAQCMEENGAKYYQILKYYFPKCKLYQYIKELP